MGVCKYQYRLEVTHGQDIRVVDADSCNVTDEWVVFFRENPCGGRALEHWRVRKDLVVSMETERS